MLCIACILMTKRMENYTDFPTPVCWSKVEAAVFVRVLKLNVFDLDYIRSSYRCEHVYRHFMLVYNTAYMSRLSQPKSVFILIITMSRSIARVVYVNEAMNVGEVPVSTARRSQVCF